MTFSEGLPLSCADTSPTGPSVAPAPDSWRTVGGVSDASPSTAGRRALETLLFEVTDASIVRDGASKYVVSQSSRESSSAVQAAAVSLGRCVNRPRLGTADKIVTWDAL